MGGPHLWVGDGDGRECVIMRKRVVANNKRKTSDDGRTERGRERPGEDGKDAGS